MSPIVWIANLSKRYDSSFQAQKSVNLAIHEGEILALLGPNGAGKMTLIPIICMGFIWWTFKAGYKIRT